MLAGANYPEGPAGLGVGCGDRINAVTFIPPHSGLPDDWSTVIASASGDHTVKLWSLDGTLRLTLEGHEERALDVDFYPATSTHGPLMASPGIDNSVILWAPRSHSRARANPRLRLPMGAQVPANQPPTAIQSIMPTCL